MNRPNLGPADLLVEAGQSFVHGWTEQLVREYGEACVALERERCAKACLSAVYAREGEATFRQVAEWMAKQIRSGSAA